MVSYSSSQPQVGFGSRIDLPYGARYGAGLEPQAQGAHAQQALPAAIRTEVDREIDRSWIEVDRSRSGSNRSWIEVDQNGIEVAVDRSWIEVNRKLDRSRSGSKSDRSEPK